MTPVPYLPTIDPKALAQIATAKGAVRPITRIDELPYDQTCLKWEKGRWVIYKQDKNPKFAGFATTLFTAMFKARQQMPWYRQ
jgi:hypothetical protein